MNKFTFTASFTDGSSIRPCEVNAEITEVLTTVFHSSGRLPYEKYVDELFDIIGKLYLENSEPTTATVSLSNDEVTHLFSGAYPSSVNFGDLECKYNPDGVWDDPSFDIIVTWKFDKIFSQSTTGSRSFPDSSSACRSVDRPIP